MTHHHPPDSNRSTVSLREIAAWQLPFLERDPFQVELPKLQRGFVWEPAKIMDLWDSILRGFPIGSMMVSTIDPKSTPDGNTTQHYWLLDGQQRATSISYGFYNPWNPKHRDSKMWSVKNIPILWLDLKPNRREWDMKLFFPYLVTQSHPWGYNQDGGVISWSERKKASESLGLGVDYFAADLSNCFPWEANFPLPVSILIEAAHDEGIDTSADFWSEIARQSIKLPAAWQSRYSEAMQGEPPESVDQFFNSLRRIPRSHVHLNYLDNETAENDTTNQDDNSLLFVRLNSGGVVLGGEELIFSLFKSAFPLAKDAVEACVAGFMAPSKLFSLLVRLAAAEEDPTKLARPVSLRDFKREIRSPESKLKSELDTLVANELTEEECEAAGLVQTARRILCGAEAGNIPDFCLPEAVATRSINGSPEVFLALLYWLRQGGAVEFGSDAHRRLLGCFTALCWFQPGNARARQDTLREWVSKTGNEVASRLWSGESLNFLFTREHLAVPVFPDPDQLEALLLKGVLEVESNQYENLPASADASFWKVYAFLPASDDETDEMMQQRRGDNLLSFVSQMRPNRTMLLYAQRSYIRKRFRSFGQWELTLKDTNCPWDWDHIYPSARGLHHVNQIYREWHNTIGNLRAEGLSENRADGCNTPTEKLALEDADGIYGWQNSFIISDLWAAMQALEYHQSAIKDPTLATKICAIVIKRMVSIYGEWHKQLGIGNLMGEIRNISSHTESRVTSPAVNTLPDDLLIDGELHTK